MIVTCLQKKKEIKKERKKDTGYRLDSVRPLFDKLKWTEQKKKKS